MKDAHLLSFVVEHPWAITPAMRRIVASVLADHINGTNDPALAALSRRDKGPQPQRGGGIAVIPVYGVIAPRANLLTDISDGTSFEELAAQLAQAVADPNVATIVFDVDSPGGSVAGAHEFALDVMKARTKKPIIAVAQYLMASAAYWGLAGATEIVAAESAQVGSIGVYTIYEDISEALAQRGIKPTVIAAGKYKGEGIDGGPLSDDALAFITALVKQHYDRFTADVAAGRGAPVAKVRSGFGEGRALDAAAALDAGMVDRLGTLADTIARLQRPAKASSVPITGQERSAVTPQESAADVHWQTAAQAELLALEMIRT